MSEYKGMSEYQNVEVLGCRSTKGCWSTKECQPDKFLVRLRNIVDVLVQEDWWFDRDELRARIPED